MVELPDRALALSDEDADLACGGALNGLGCGGALAGVTWLIGRGGDVMRVVAECVASLSPDAPT